MGRSARMGSRHGGERRSSTEGSREDQLLVDALRGHRFSIDDPQPSARLVSAADHHGVAIALHRAYGERATDELAATARNRRAEALRIAKASIDVSECLRADGISHGIVKGPAIAAAYPDADRAFVDLDVLVAGDHMSASIESLAKLGAELLDGLTWPRDDGVGEIPLGLPSGVTVDLHADLIHHADVRSSFELRPEALLERLETVAVLGRALPTLAPEDALIYAALHAVLSGGDRLIWLSDVDALVRNTPVHWPALVERARRARLGLVVAVMLQRSVLVLGTPVPAQHLSTLSSGGRLWLALLAAFDRRRPSANSFGRHVRGQVLVRATRAGTLSSASALIRLIWSDVVLLVIRDANHPWRAAIRRERQGSVHRHGQSLVRRITRRRLRDSSR